MKLINMILASVLSLSSLAFATDSNKSSDVTETRLIALMKEQTIITIKYFEAMKGVRIIGQMQEPQLSTFISIGDDYLKNLNAQLEIMKTVGGKYFSNINEILVTHATLLGVVQAQLAEAKALRGDK